MLSGIMPNNLAHSEIGKDVCTVSVTDLYSCNLYFPGRSVYVSPFRTAT